jgi:hypothetical protein
LFSNELIILNFQFLILQYDTYNPDKQKLSRAGPQWLTPVILAAQKAEIRRIEVQSQPGQIV